MNTTEKPAIPLAEWLEQGLSLFGGAKENWKSWRFQCPICGNVATPQQFEDAGADPQRSYQECIGRLLPAKPARDGQKQPCDYAAFGLLRLSKAPDVIAENGRRVSVFPFAAEIPGKSQLASAQRSGS